MNEAILNEIRQLTQHDQCVSVVGAPGSGKTALLTALGQQQFLVEGLEYVQFNCSPLRSAEYPTIFAALTASVVQAAQKAGISLPSTANPFSQRLVFEAMLRQLNQHGLRVALILDDFDALAANPQINVSFFDALRSIAIRHQLVYVTASTKPLFDLTFHSNTEELLTSPFFNLFVEVRV